MNELNIIITSCDNCPFHRSYGEDGSSSIYDKDYCGANYEDGYLVEKRISDKFNCPLDRVQINIKK